MDEALELFKDMKAKLETSRAEASKLREALLAVEWLRYGALYFAKGDACPCCGCKKIVGHINDCRIANALEVTK